MLGGSALPVGSCTLRPRVSVPVRVSACRRRVALRQGAVALFTGASGPLSLPPAVAEARRTQVSCKAKPQ